MNDLPHAPPTRLADDELTDALLHLPGFARVEGAAAAIEGIEAWFHFVAFDDAIAFVNAAAAAARALDHHPDLDVRYNRVRVGLSTHDSGGVTALDTTLAGRLIALAATLPRAPHNDAEQKP
jgi:4a-hydroxytetrahydrobiopterin dehydratase